MCFSVAHSELQIVLSRSSAKCGAGTHTHDARSGRATNCAAHRRMAAEVLAVRCSQSCGRDALPCSGVAASARPGSGLYLNSTLLFLGAWAPCVIRPTCCVHSSCQKAVGVQPGRSWTANSSPPVSTFLMLSHNRAWLSRLLGFGEQASTGQLRAAPAAQTARVLPAVAASHGRLPQPRWCGPARSALHAATPRQSQGRRRRALTRLTLLTWQRRRARLQGTQPFPWICLPPRRLSRLPIPSAGGSRRRRSCR